MTKSTLTSRPPAGPLAPPFAAPDRYRRGARGFTLIELMVSISIMAIIALAFGGLMTQANVVVTQGEKRMRSDAAASAVSRIIRGDIRRMTKNGFLQINGGMLVFVTAGRTQSVITTDGDGDPIIGDGAIIVYGRDEDSSVLFRKVIVLAKDAKIGVDCLNKSLAEVQVMSADEMTQLINQVAQMPSSMAYPPQTLKQLMDTMWMVLAGDCEELVIACRPPQKETWTDNTTCTRHNQTNWPDSIRFRFTLKPGTLISSAVTDEEILDKDAEIPYEIICPIGH